MRRQYFCKVQIAFTLKLFFQDDMGLDVDQVNVLKRCFDGFADEDGAIPAENVGNILSMMGLRVKPSALKDIIEEIDEDGTLTDCVHTQ